MDDDLIARVRALSPELFDQIKTEVLNPPTSKITIVDSTFKYPVQLHINRQHRESFAKNYFANAIVKFTNIEIFSKCCSTLEELEVSYIKSIAAFTLPHLASGEDDGWHTLLEFACSLRCQDLPFVLQDAEVTASSGEAFWVCRREELDEVLEEQL